MIADKVQATQNGSEAFQIRINSIITHVRLLYASMSLVSQRLIQLPYHNSSPTGEQIASTRVLRSKATEVMFSSPGKRAYP